MRAMANTILPCVGFGGVISTILPRTNSVRRPSSNWANSSTVISFSAIDMAGPLLRSKTIHHTPIGRDHKLAVRDSGRAREAAGGLMLPCLLAVLQVQAIKPT